MKTIVFDVPAENGGALTILSQYYDKALNSSDEWLFILSTPIFTETNNVKTKNYPWIKKSWIHRYFFDFFIAKRLVKKYIPDQILSLQNTIVSGVNVYQTLYLHQPLPFVEKRYKIYENLRFWMYQNIISKLVYKSVKKADKVIVQTNWLKDACIEKLDVSPSKFEIIQPNLNVKVKKQYSAKEVVQFFYPSSALEYKNHRVIVDAVNKLVESGIKNFRVVFTLNGDENKNILNLYKLSKKELLPIDFVGAVSISKVYDFYSESILIFPSYIETFGLPMLEAKMHKCPIIASDCAFSHEILDNYDNVAFFNPFEFGELKDIMIPFVGNK